MANKGIFCRNYTTAPSLRDAAGGGKMLPIALSFTNSWSIDNIVNKGIVQTCQSNKFAEQLPEILRGKRPEWTLWHVQILPQQFSLLYTRQHSPEEIQAAFPDGSKPLDFDYGRVTVVRQDVSMELTVPAYLDNPEVIARYQLEHDAPRTLTVHLGETVNEKRVFYLKLCTDLPLE